MILNNKTSKITFIVQFILLLSFPQMLYSNSGSNEIIKIEYRNKKGTSYGIEKITRYAIICGGNPHDVQQARWYKESSLAMYQVLKNKFGYNDQNIYYLYGDNQWDNDTSENSSQYRDIIDGKATKGNIRKVLQHLAPILEERDQLFISLLVMQVDIRVTHITNQRIPY